MRTDVKAFVLLQMLLLDELVLVIDFGQLLNAAGGQSDLLLFVLP